MALLTPSLSKSFSSLQEMPNKTSRTFHLNPKILMSLTDSAIAKPTSFVAEPTEKKTGFGFKNFTGTFFMNVKRAEGRLMETVNLRVPAITGGTEVDQIENVAIRVELRNGFVGWGEALVVPTVGRAAAVEKVTAACEFLRRCPAMTLDSVLDEIENLLPGHEFSSVRSGVEMALIDAAANSINVPLWRLFGGCSNSLSTSITIPIRSPEETFRVVSKYSSKGFKAFRLNIGKDLDSEMEAFRAVRSANRKCTVILDANEAYSPPQALQLLDRLQGKGGDPPVVLEQPVKGKDMEGLRQVHERAREMKGAVVIGVDEGCKNITEAHRIIRERVADVINLKLSKFGVIGSLELIEAAKIAGFELMIEGSLETRLATGFAGHLAAGLGCFKYVALDGPFMQLEDPIIGGYEVGGSVYKFTNSRGQGGFLKWHVDVSP
ncbi:PREDICTED: L-Ala-D/L-amino acid epimerase-like [Tarenaya hassleriana]|uniref:L-Ala-D/L-amino acid epimerase-like n=1 Tax=Tarenaya hassleriana TaxID=28532 RepID=UPI00053C6B55|nr:PREDICTED: L-Ala-D/L-amino acid epimerase-like [Tarenaya hassleriana]